MNAARAASPTMPTRITEGPVRLATPDQLGRWSLRCHAAGMTVGLVPTMGALHRGHRTLVLRALADCDRVVVSIFVNPTQFAPGEDFLSYPRDLEADLDPLRAAGVHAVFTPSVQTMYPPGGSTSIHVGGAGGGEVGGGDTPGRFRARGVGGGQ